MATQLNDCAAVRCHLHTLSCNQWKHCYSWPIFGISFLYTLLGCTHNIFVTVRLLIFKYLLKTSDQNGKYFDVNWVRVKPYIFRLKASIKFVTIFVYFLFFHFLLNVGKRKLKNSLFKKQATLYIICCFDTLSLSLRYIIALTDTYLLTDWVTWIHYNSHVRTIESLEINVFRQASCCQLVTRRVRAKMI